MKIAVNTRLLISHQMEGIARYIYETTRRIVATHPEDEFHFIFDRAYDAQFIFGPNVIPHVYSPPARHPFLWYLWYEWALPRAFKKIKPEVFLSGDMYLSLSSQVPTVMVSHDLNFEHYPEFLPTLVSKYYRHYSPQYHHRADKLIAVSQATKADIIKTYLVKEQKISVATNATPEGFFPFTDQEKKEARLKYAEGAPYFLFVGSLHPRKNLARLLKAFDNFKSSGLPHKLVIYGRQFFKTGDIFDTHKNMAHKESVLFIDSTICTVPEIMGGATALCYPSLFEGFGIPILEGFAAEVPVITSDISSMPEVAGDAALLVDPLSESSIQDAMLSVTKDKALATALIGKGRQRKTLFSWDKSAEIIYQALTAGRHQ